MAKLPKKTLIDRIDAVTIESYPRPHLGASIVGNQCRRKTAYSFYWAHKTKVEARLNRIFRAGDDIEVRLVQALESIGIDVDIGVDGEQITVVDETGHAGGSVDGKLTNVPGFEGETLLFEGKSMNHNNYLELVRKGVQLAKPVHYVQMNMYMGRLHLDFALYAAMNKNDSKIHIEIVPFDVDCFEEHKDIEQSVFFAKHINEFTRISTNPSWFLCKTCDAKDICQGSGDIDRNCRTCKYSEMYPKGKWFCNFKGCELSPQMQRDGCTHFELSEMWV